jgi:hypothetical protein
MRQLLHLLAADARRCRWALLLWVAVAGAGALTDAALWAKPPGGQALNAAALLTLAGLLLTVALVSLVAHADPAVGADAFWMTRPIHPVALPLAKVLLLALALIGVPILLQIFAMAAAGMRPSDLWLASLQTALVRSVILAILLSIAVLTPTMTRYIAGCVGLLAVAPLLTWAASSTLSEAQDPSLWLWLLGDTPDRALGLSRLTLSALLIVAVGLTGVLRQYQRRRTAGTAALLLAGGVCAVLTAAAWPWSTFHREQAAPPWADVPSALALTNGGRVSWIERPSDDPAQLWAMDTLHTTTSPSGHWRIRALLREASLETAEGVRLDSQRSHSFWVVTSSDQEDGVRRALDVEHLGGTWQAPGPGVLFVGSAAALRTAVWPGIRYRGTFMMLLDEIEVAAILPLAAGSTFHSGGYRFLLDDVELDDGVVRVFGRNASVNTVFDQVSRPQYEYFLRNRERREVIRGMHRLRSQDGLVAGLGPSAGWQASGFLRSHTQTVFAFWGAGRGARALVHVDEAWLAGAEIVIVRYRPAGAVERTLVLEELPPPAVDTQG